jgi:FAD/FMN-containing dehydrogenase
VGALWEALRRYSTGGVYVNFLTEEEGAERLEAAYRGTNYARLAQLKAVYDPANLFRHNQNIKPTI